MTTAAKVKRELREKRNPEKAAFYPRFFKAGPGEYGEGDKFIGVVVPDQRKIARQFRDLELPEVRKLLDDSFHECRLTGLLILVIQYERANDDAERREVHDFYVRHFDRVNNWDLVDATAHKILGPQSEFDDRSTIHKFSQSGSMWRQRAAVIATLHFIKQDDFADTMTFCEQFLDHPHDLIHKATGWMLREVGKRDEAVLRAFLDEHAGTMPRTMLRYAIEKLPESRRKRYLAAGSR